MLQAYSGAQSLVCVRLSTIAFFPVLAITFAIENVFPEPVTPSRV